MFYDSFFRTVSYTITLLFLSPLSHLSSLSSLSSLLLCSFTQVEPPWQTKADCKYESEYFDDIDPNPNNHECVACPYGALCKDQDADPVLVLSAADVQPKAGYWRVPWSVQNNMSLIFVKCPFSTDCRGYIDYSDLMFKNDIINSGDDDEEEDDSATKNRKMKEVYLYGGNECVNGTKGPLCSMCLKGYNRDVQTCNECPEAAFAVRVGVLLSILFLLIGSGIVLRKKIATKWRKYKSLTRDLLRVFSINITYAQINSSMTSIIEIEWPANWHKFVGYFKFVNIDIMSLVGAKCISDFDYYGSFSIMVCMPVAIFVATIVGYNVAVAASKRKLKRLTKKQETDLHREALRKLFEYADSG